MDLANFFRSQPVYLMIDPIQVLNTYIYITFMIDPHSACVHNLSYFYFHPVYRFHYSVYRGRL